MNSSLPNYTNYPELYPTTNSYPNSYPNDIVIDMHTFSQLPNQALPPPYEDVTTDLHKLCKEKEVKLLEEISELKKTGPAQFNIGMAFGIGMSIAGVVTFVIIHAYFY